MLKPTQVYKLFGDSVAVYAFGVQPGGEKVESEEIIVFALENGAKKIRGIDVSRHNALVLNFSEVDESERPQVDGLVLALPGQAVWLRTADCPTLVIKNQNTGNVAVAHASRNSLLKNLIPTIFGHVGNSLAAFSCIGIAAKDYTHPPNYPGYENRNQQLVRNLVDQYSTRVFEGDPYQNGALDLHKLIEQQFIKCGVRESQISHDDVNTFDDKRFHSHRREGESRQGRLNHILVIRRL